MQDDDVTIDTDGIEEGGSEEELEAAESGANARVAKMKRELDACKKEKQEYLDGWQRAKADYVNVLKRFETENLAAREQGMLKALKALLPAYDALERAKEHGELPEGFQGITKQLEGAFSSLGIESVGEVGEQFDPMLHEALGTDVAESKDEDDTVSIVLEKGYRAGDTVIRPAKVRVKHFEA